MSEKQFFQMGFAQRKWDMDKITRRTFIKGTAVGVGAMASGILPGQILAETQKPKVYFTKELSPEALIKIYDKVNQGISGKVALKLHTGEPGGPNIIPREWAKAFMAHVPNSRIVECNVLYDSPRQTTEGHRKTLETNGWSAFTSVDIMDENGDAVLPIPGGKRLTEVAVGKNLLNYDSMIALTHFKGHVMGGFGGSLKNISIGCASGKVGKKQLHSEGDTTWSGGPNFMERMVEGGKAVTNHFGPHITYINVLRNMSISCDCEGVKAAPVTLPNLGILASTDILAVDQASVDMVYALPEDVRAPMVERIESRSGLRQLTYMKEMGMGSSQYELVTL